MQKRIATIQVNQPIVFSYTEPLYHVIAGIEKLNGVENHQCYIHVNKIIYEDPLGFTLSENQEASDRSASQEMFGLDLRLDRLAKAALFAHRCGDPVCRIEARRINDSMLIDLYYRCTCRDPDARSKCKTRFGGVYVQTDVVSRSMIYFVDRFDGEVQTTSYVKSRGYVDTVYDFVDFLKSHFS